MRRFGMRERESGMAEPRGGEGQVQQARSRIARPLTDLEVRELIDSNFIAVLATVGDGQPYAIPFIYGYEDGAFFAVLSPGRKVRNIETNARVCVTIVQTWDMGKRWRSVLATGTANWIRDEEQLGPALEAIKRQYPGIPVRSTSGTAVLKGYYMLRVDVEEMTGRGHD
jgi:nitroimidazol reductase NimA-like FMN-containing flavoprotein (pyridoxamine 5'-phosphate oxidase superfamily)